MNQHEPEAQRAAEAVARSQGLRARLLQQLNDLERGLQMARKLVEETPEGKVPAPQERKVRWPWKH